MLVSLIDRNNAGFSCVYQCWHVEQDLRDLLIFHAYRICTCLYEGEGRVEGVWADPAEELIIMHLHNIAKTSAKDFF